MKFSTVLVFVVLIWQASFAQEHGLINNATSPHMKLKSIDFDDCHWTEGFWADKVDLCNKVMLPNLGRLMEDPEIIHAYDNFLVAAGMKEGEFRGWSFHDGDFYKYVEAMAYIYEQTKDEAINKKMDEIIAVIAKAQEEDGYIHTKKQIGHGVQGFHHKSEKRGTFKTEHFISGGEHEFYNFGHLMTAACVHHRITSKTNFLDIAIKASDLIYDKFKDPSPALARIDWNPPHYMGLIEMYRTTGDKRYLEVTQSFVDMLGTAKAVKGDHRGLDHSQRRTPIRKETKAHGHAGHGNYLYCGVADLYAETGEQALLDALERIWHNIAKEKMYLTGATGPHHFGISDNGDYVAEAYGKDYELPNTKCYNETCANIGNAMWNWRMFLLNGEARFADIVELIFYNSGLSGISLEGRDYYYTNPLRFIQGHPQNTKDNGQRSPFLSVFCCPPNITRTIAKMNNYAYCTSEEGIWVNLYGGNVLKTELADGSKVGLTQKTDYPWDGHVELTVDVPKKKTFSLKLRIPAWAMNATLKVNGKTVYGRIRPGLYFDLKRKWMAGDVIELNMPMKPQLVQANPWAEEVLNQVAIKRGPLVYCLESVDLPAGIGVTDIVIPQDIELTAQWGTKKLKGIKVLKGKALRRPKQDWSDHLYRPLKSVKLQTVDITLIPYYAWSNRGITGMTVWMPVQY